MVGVVLNKKDINTSVGEALKLVAYRLKMLQTANEFFPELAEKITTDLAVKSDRELQEMEDRTCESDSYNLGIDLIDSNNETFETMEDIPSLKKQIKYCKNYLERARLQKQLNEAYKRRKKLCRHMN